MNQQIAGASEQQSVVAQQVSVSMQRVRGVAEDNARESVELQRSTIELQRVGGELNDAVGHFRLSEDLAIPAGNHKLDSTEKSSTMTPYSVSIR